MQENALSDTQTAYVQIRSRILDGRLAPDHRVSPRSIAEELTLGHTPVRSAIQRLVVEGLVKVIPKKGTYVASPTTDDLREIFQVRLALESTAAYLAALNGPTPALTNAAVQMRQIIGLDTVDLMSEQRIGWTFHHELFTASRNERLFTMYAGLRVQTGLALNELPRNDAATVRRGTLEHLDIYEAIAAKNPADAQRCMWNHVVDGTDARIKIIRGQHEHSA